MKLGNYFGKLQLRRKGLLPEMQSLAEISHFPAKVITPVASFLFPSATQKTAVSVNESLSKMHAIQHNTQVNAWLALAICALHVTNCRTNSHGNGRPVTGPIYSHCVKRMDSPVPRQSEPLVNNPIFCSPPSDLIIYDQGELDRGAYGSVYAGEFAGKPVAVKRIHKVLLEAQLTQGQQVRRDFQAECQRMKDIGEHTNVVGFIGAFQDRTGPFLVMEKMSQNLHKFLEDNRGKLKLQQQLRLCLDIATGLAFLHSQKPPLVHRDLTAKNVLLDESRRAKIGDLGQSKLRTAAHFQTRQPGAVPYMPPEALRTQPQYTEKVDIFSFGVLMLEIATQIPPSVGLDGISTIPEEERRSSDLNLLAEDHPLKSLIRLCLKDEPGRRPDVATLERDLQQLAQVVSPNIRRYHATVGGKIFWRNAENMSFGRIYFGGWASLSD